MPRGNQSPVACSLHRHPRSEKFSCFQFRQPQCDQNCKPASDWPCGDPGLDCPCLASLVSLSCISQGLWITGCGSPPLSSSSPVTHIFYIPLSAKQICFFPLHKGRPCSSPGAAASRASSFMGCVTGVHHTQMSAWDWLARCPSHSGGGVQRRPNPPSDLLRAYSGVPL